MKTRAQNRSALVQNTDSVFEFTVREIIAMGRYPWIGTQNQLNDQSEITNAIKKLELQNLENRKITTLSTGEKTRVSFGRIIAQSSPIILLDEPTTALDIKQQINLMRLVKDFTQNKGSALVIAHDLNLALNFADVVSFLLDGKIIASGKPDEIVTSELISRVYGIEADIYKNPVTKKISVNPII